MLKSDARRVAPEAEPDCPEAVGWALLPNAADELDELDEQAARAAMPAAATAIQARRCSDLVRVMRTTLREQMRSVITRCDL